MATKPTYEGTCLCGACTVKVYGPERTYQERCHCKDCQILSGTAFASSIMAQKMDVEFLGGDKIGRFSSSTDSGNTSTRLFCLGCGAQLGQDSPLFKERIAVQTGILRDYFCKIPYEGGDEIYVKDRWVGIPLVPNGKPRWAMYHGSTPPPE
ncbi:hypothetical protein JCM10207_007955 [Rhodosporidiobolus poonsookiae]